MSDELHSAAEVDSRLKVALRAVESAGAILMASWGRLGGYERKSDIDLVTEADLRSEQQILAELRAAFPADLVVAEERDGRDGVSSSSVDAAPWCWVVDPLDGTTNYAHGHPQFAVSVGLLRFGAPLLGIVLAPARRELYVGGVDIPATVNGTPLKVSTVRRLDDSLLASGFPYDRRERVDALLTRVRRALLLTQGFRRAGSAALDLAELAAGRTDGFWEEGLAPWDMAAGVSVVMAAGGLVTSLTGDPWDLFNGGIVASNGALHHALVRDVVQGNSATTP